MVSFVFADTINASVAVSLPTGFTVNNTFVIGTRALSGTNVYANHRNVIPIFRLNDVNNIYIATDNSVFLNQYGSIILMRIN